MSLLVGSSRRRLLLWTGWVVAALCALPVFEGWRYTAVVICSAVILAMRPGALPPRVSPSGPTSDLAVIAVLYVVVVALMRVAFVVFGVDQIPGLFLSFSAALLLGVLGPLVYTVWFRGGRLRDLGLRLDNWRQTALLAALLGAVQFAFTLWGYQLPEPVNWVPLLCMALVVGVFESVFFRGFIQNRLSEHFGPAAGVGGAAVLYGLYHVGYGMGGAEIVFLTGLGVVYAIAFSLTRNVLILWPLLTPLGSFYANVTAGDIELPWMAILGFADVALLMVAAMLLSYRRERRGLHRYGGPPARVSA
jgi:membrane protease YdiL (CAAX protease family)